MIYICGDFHAKFGEVNKFINTHRDASIILQCGDFGFWPKEHGKTYKDDTGRLQVFNQYSLKTKGAKLYFIDGNHEDHGEIDLLNTKYQPEIQPNVIYMRRGSTMILPDSRRVLFIGGASSIDKKYRTFNIDWFPQETISQRDILNLPDGPIDIVISHTAPLEFKVVDYHEEWDKDPSRDALSYVLNKYHPKLWYFAHMHKFQQGVINGCKWTCLSGIGLEGRWWIPLEDAK